MHSVRICAPALALMALSAAPAFARPEYARKENVTCLYCHVQPGGPRNFRGMYYRAHNRSFAEFDNVFEAKMAGVSPEAMGGDARPTTAGYPRYAVAPALSFTVKDIDGKNVSLGR